MHSSSPPVLVWLRRDLRLHDHAPLAAALAAGGSVVPVYVLEPSTLRPSGPLGVPRCGPFRARFLIESLEALRRGYRERGGDLVVRVGDPERVLAELTAELGAVRVFAHREVGTEERAQERALSAALESRGARLRLFDGQSMVAPDDLPYPVREVPPVFTRFRTRVEREVEIPEPLPAPTRMPEVSVEPGALPTLASLGIEEPTPSPLATRRIVGGEDEALARVHEWIWLRDRLRTYKATRNGLLDADDASLFSPWLAMGCLSARQVHAEVRRYERQRVRNEDTHWLIVELLWRDYFRFVAEQQGARLFASDGPQGVAFPWRTLSSRDARADFDRWATGTTGFPLVDAAMRELRATGFTSNRARQNVASFLTRVLGLDWRLGAAWFESWLVDYDVASNWGNWGYVAGVGQDARGFRFFNVYKQAQDYDPDARFVRHWLPELAGLSAADAQRPERVVPPVEYPAPMVDMHQAAQANERRYARVAGPPPGQEPPVQRGARRPSGGGRR